MIRKDDLRNREYYPNGIYEPQYDIGSYTSPPGVPFEKRGLPGDSSDYIEVILKVKEPFSVTRSRATPAFDFPGKGIQDELGLSVQDLYELGGLE